MNGSTAPASAVKNYTGNGSIMIGLGLGFVIADLLGGGGGLILGAVMSVVLLGTVAFTWRGKPGFLVGIGLTLAIAAAIGTSCAALLNASGL